MNISNIALVYFSATNVSKQYAQAMAQALDVPVETYDLTLPAGRDITPPTFSQDTLVIVAMPVYSGRVIPAALPFLKAMTSDQGPCIPVVTYGNRHFDDALVELEDLMVTAGFTVVGAAAVVGRHSLSDQIAGHRPDGADLAQATAFAKAVVAKDLAGLPLGTIPGQRPYKTGGNPNGFYSTPTDGCVNCKLCAKNCPMGVISLEDVGVLSKPATACILCNRCVVNCPKQVRVFQDEGYQAMVAHCIATFSQPARENLLIV